MAALLWALLAPSHAAEVRYVYDELGRLVEVVAPDGASAQYRYDAVGNISAIERHAANALSVAEFSPNSGAVNTPVTIYGSGFSSVAASNSVSFNGVAAVVSAATSTSLVVTVPAGASSGKITVANSNGSASSSGSFIIGAGAAPTISSFTPTIGILGSAVTISGSNFQTAKVANKITFGGMTAATTTASATSLGSSVPGAAASGRITVATPYGKAVSGSDFYAVPGGINPAEIEYVGRIDVGGAVKTVTIGTAGKKALLIFDGAQWQYLSLLVTGSTFGSAVSASVYRPDGTLLIAGSVAGNDVLDFSRLPSAGTYTVLLSPAATDKGKIDLQLKAEALGVLSVDGAPLPLSLAAGVNGRYTFGATTGQRLTLGYTGVSTNPAGQSVGFAVYKPDGTLLFSDSWANDNSNTLPVLPTSGTYAVLVNPRGLATANLTLTLSTELAGALVIDGAPVSFASTRAGQNGRYTFTGAAGQTLGLGYTGFSRTPSGAGITYGVYKPDGGLLFSDSWGNNNSNNLPKLPLDGTYVVLVDPSGVAAANVTLTLSSDVAGVLLANAAPTTFSSARAGQNGRYTFTGTAGQKYWMAWSNGSFGVAAAINVLKPDGTSLVTGSVKTGATLDIPLLPASGTYTVFIDPVAADTGRVDLQLNSAPVDLVGVIVADGAALQLDLGLQQRAAITFNGTAGQTLGLGYGAVATVPAAQSLTYSVIKPDGVVLFSETLPGNNSSSLPTLPVSGSYTISVVPQAGVTGASLALTLSSDLVGVLAVDGASTTFSSARPGQNGRYSFPALAGQKLTLGYTGFTTSPAGQSLKYSVYKPDGVLLFSDSWSNDNSNSLPLLPVSGDYTLLVDPRGAALGANVTLTLSTELAGALVIDGAPVSFASTRAGQNGRYTFTGAAGQTLGLGYTGFSRTPAGGSITYGVYKPDGGLLFSDSWGNNNSNNLPKLPLDGTYSVLVDPSGVAAANVTLTLSSDVAGVLLANAAPTTFSSARPGQNGRYTFSGTAGQKYWMAWSNGSFGVAAAINVLKPDGTSLVTGSVKTGATLDIPLLPASGTYTVFIDPAAADTGRVDLQLNSAPVDLVGVIVADGAPLQLDLGLQQRAALTFNGTAGQTLGLGYGAVATVPAAQSLTYSVIKPDGVVLFSETLPGNNSSSLPALPVSGSYTISVVPQAGVTGASLALSLSSDLAGVLAIDGASTTFSSARPGQNGRYSFPALAGQKLTLGYTGFTTSPVGQILKYSVYKPDGVLLFSDTWSNDNSNLLPALPVSGDYTLLVDPRGAALGANVTLTLSTELAGALVIDGASVSFASTRAGQNGRYTFTGAAGQTLGLGYTGFSRTPAGGSITYGVYKPDGGLLFSDSWGNNNSNNLPKLPLDGTYAVLVDPSGVAAANVTLTLSSDSAGTLLANAAPTTFSSERPGQNGRYTFSGTAGQLSSLALSNKTFPSTVLVSVFKPDGSSLTSASVTAATTVGMPALPVAGIYSVLIDPSTVTTGAIDVQLK
nr:IPT/TIG domain-containing protein [Rugamonas sp. CCM 8940]